MDERWLAIQWDWLHRCVYAEWKGFANAVFTTRTFSQVPEALEWAAEA